MKIIFSFLFLISFQINLAQNNDYQHVDVNYNKIDYDLFLNKYESELFDIVIFNDDSLKYKKLRFKEFYGELDKNKHSQLKKLFQKRFKSDSLKTWVIHFFDSLPDLKKMSNKTGFVLLDSTNKPTSKVLSLKGFNSKLKKSPIKRHKHVFNADDYLRRMEGEILNFDKKLEIIHFYNFNKGIPEKILLQLNYFQDQNLLIQRTFSDSNKNYQNILLYPNGEFYVSMFGNTEKNKKLRIKKKFDRFKKKWQRQILDINISK